MVDGILLDYYLLSLIMLGVDPSIQKPEAIGHVLKDQYGLPLYRNVLQPVKDRAKRSVEVVLYDIQGLKDPDVLDMLVPYGVNGIITSSKTILKLYPMMANAERRFILDKLRSLEE
jgi:hypothetical protein